MIIDITKIELTPGNMGKDCLGNGKHDFEICCDECDYFLCCNDESYPQRCAECTLNDCPRQNNNKLG